MGEAKRTHVQSELPADRPSERVLLSATVMEPGLESTSRSANKIREELGLPAYRYVLVWSDGLPADDVIENIRIAILRAIARTEAAPGRIEILERTSRRRVGWAEGGALYGDQGQGETSVDELVRDERKRVSITP